VSRSPGRDSRARRIGIFGGTFDPPHFGHLALAEWARAELRLDRVLFVPAGRPPHKPRSTASSTAHRLAMTRLAVRGNAAFAVEPLETRRRGPSFTADTVRALAARWPRASLHLLLGEDMYATFDTWREPEAIAEHAVLAVALRPGTRTPRRSRAASGGRGVVWLRNPGLEISSSVLRVRARRGLSLRYLVPDAVARYVARHGLYQGQGRAGRAALVRRSV
jgi:nicotinate-nucleotide adenylyltransferase